MFPGRGEYLDVSGFQILPQHQLVVSDTDVAKALKKKGNYENRDGKEIEVLCRLINVTKMNRQFNSNTYCQGTHCKEGKPL